MLRRSTKVQLIIFVIITLIGVSYVSAKYVGLTNGLFGDPCTVKADFPDSGGIFTNAEVTYRGVTVGRVGELRLTSTGVQVDLDLSDCGSPSIPANAQASVHTRSVIGEQYVDLVPTGSSSQKLRGGSVIRISPGDTPIQPQTLLANLDTLVKSVNVQQLQTVVDELGKAFSGQGPKLSALLKASSTLVTAARNDLPNTEELIRNTSTVLGTQLDLAPSLDSFTHNLDLLSQQFKTSDPDIRRLLDNGPADFTVLTNFIENNQTDLGVTLANLATTGDMIVRHLGSVEEILELYPFLAAGGQTVLGADGVGALGLVLDPQHPTTQVPPDCGDPTKGREGYGGTTVRNPGDTSPAAPNVAAHCTAPVSSGVNVRGSANVPGGDPISVPASVKTYPRVVTDNTVVGTVGAGQPDLGDDSWITMLTNGLN